MGWLDALAPVIGGALGLAGSYIGGKQAQAGYDSAANASNYATDRAIQAQMDMFNTMRADTAPLRDLLPGALGDLASMGRAASPERQWMNEYAQLAIPQLQNQVNVDYQNDPIFQAQRDEMLKTLNRRYASQGRFMSSDADNAITRNILPFMQDSYNRNLADMERRNQNALTNYGLGTNRAQTLFGLEGSLGDQRWGRQLDLAKLGAGAATAAGQGAQTTGANLAGTIQSGGNTMASILANRGQSNAQMWGNMAGAAQGGLNNQMLYNYLNK